MRFIQKIKANFEINNLFVNINEQDYSIYLNLCNNEIKIEDAIYFYKKLIDMSQQEFSRLKQSCNLDKNNLAKKEKEFDRLMFVLSKRREQLIDKSSFKNNVSKK